MAELSKDEELSIFKAKQNLERIAKYQRDFIECRAKVRELELDLVYLVEKVSRESPNTIENKTSNEIKCAIDAICKEYKNRLEEINRAYQGMIDSVTLCMSVK